MSAIVAELQRREATMTQAEALASAINDWLRTDAGVHEGEYCPHADADDVVRILAALDAAGWALVPKVRLAELERMEADQQPEAGFGWSPDH